MDDQQFPLSAIQASFGMDSTQYNEFIESLHSGNSIPPLETPSQATQDIQPMPGFSPLFNLATPQTTHPFRSLLGSPTKAPELQSNVPSLVLPEAPAQVSPAQQIALLEPAPAPSKPASEIPPPKTLTLPTSEPGGDIKERAITVSDDFRLDMSTVLVHPMRNHVPERPPSRDMERLARAASTPVMNTFDSGHPISSLSQGSTKYECPIPDNSNRYFSQNAAPMPSGTPEVAKPIPADLPRLQTTPLSHQQHHSWNIAATRGQPRAPAMVRGRSHNTRLRSYTSPRQSQPTIYSTQKQQPQHIQQLQMQQIPQVHPYYHNMVQNPHTYMYPNMPFPMPYGYAQLPMIPAYVPQELLPGEHAHDLVNYIPMQPALYYQPPITTHTTTGRPRRTFRNSKRFFLQPLKTSDLPRPDSISNLISETNDSQICNTPWMRGQDANPPTRPYQRLPAAPPPWGPPERPTLFKYTSTGQWTTTLKLSNEELRCYVQDFVSQDSSTSRQLKAWVQYTPAEKKKSKHLQCRWANCPVPGYEISEGFFRIAFDEFPGLRGKNLDPFVFTGCLHLHCFEKIFNIAQLLQLGIVQPDMRKFPCEPSNPFAMDAGSGNILQDAFRVWAQKSTASFEKDGLDLPINRKDNLWYCLSTTLVESLTNHQRKQFAEGPNSLLTTQGDLDAFSHCRRAQSAEKGYKLRGSISGLINSDRSQTSVTRTMINLDTPVCPSPLSSREFPGSDLPLDTPPAMRLQQSFRKMGQGDESSRGGLQEMNGKKRGLDEEERLVKKSKL